MSARAASDNQVPRGFPEADQHKAPGPHQPYADRAATIVASERYLASESGRMLRSLGADLIIGAREGARFQDAYTGQWYWNAHCNGGVFNLGHRNPRLLQALRDALDDLDVGNHRFTSGIRARAAERLVQSTGGAHTAVVFNASGGEASDLALRLARGVTGRKKIVSIKGCYHGHTGIAISTTDLEFSRPLGGRLPGFKQVPWDDPAAMEKTVDDQTAAVIMETQPSSRGFLLPSEGYLEGVARLCRERGALFIIDEVQTGLGRTGTVWSWQQYDFQPDIFLSGKGLSGGVYPMAATIMRQPTFDYLRAYPYGQICTYGGNEIGSAVVCELLDMVDNAEFLAHVRELSAQFTEGFKGAPFSYWTRGLSGGIGGTEPTWAHQAMRRLYENGVWAVFSSFNKRALQWKPVMTMSAAEAEQVIEQVRTALG